MQNECKQFYGFGNRIFRERGINMTNKDINMIQENIRRDSFKNEYWGLYQDVWNFHKKYSNVQTMMRIGKR